MRFLSRSSRGSGENRPRLSTRPASHSPVPLPKRDNVIRLFADFHPEHRVGGINGLGYLGSTGTPLTSVTIFLSTNLHPVPNRFARGSNDGNAAEVREKSEEGRIGFIDIYFVHSVLLRDLSLSLYPLIYTRLLPAAITDARVSSNPIREEFCLSTEGSRGMDDSLRYLLPLLSFDRKRVFPRRVTTVDSDTACVS